MKTEFLIAAQTEFEESIAFYNQQRDELGFEFANEVVGDCCGHIKAATDEHR